MEIADIIKQTMITEVDGVAVANSFHYIVKDEDLATDVQDLAAAVHLRWWELLDELMSDRVNTTCSIWENLMGNDPTFAKFATLPGIAVEDNMAADNAIAVTCKAVNSALDIATGTLKFSGLFFSLQDGGHLDDYDAALLMEAWLTSDQAYGPTILRSVQKTKVLGVNEFPEVQVAQTNPHVVKVPSRRSKLCAVA